MRGLNLCILLMLKDIFSLGATHFVFLSKYLCHIVSHLGDRNIILMRGIQCLRYDKIYDYHTYMYEGHPIITIKQHLSVTIKSSLFSG